MLFIIRKNNKNMLGEMGKAPTSGMSSRSTTSAGSPEPPMAKGTGASVCEVSATGLPSCRIGLSVFFSRCAKGGRGEEGLGWVGVCDRFHVAPGKCSAVSLRNFS